MYDVTWIHWGGYNHCHFEKSHNDVVRCDFIVRLFKRNKIIFKFSTGGFESTSRRVVKASERNVVGHMQPTVIDQSEWCIVSSAGYYGSLDQGHRKHW